MVYNIMLLTFILTPSFSSPILEENAVRVRNNACTATFFQLLHLRQPLLNCSIKKFKSINLNPCFQNSVVILQGIDFVLLQHV